MSNNVGYHLTKIKKGINGKSSKILEEVHELIDAEAQGSKIMALAELSDLYGAIDLYLSKNYSELEMNDLKVMSQITARAFRNGRR